MKPKAAAAARMDNPVDQAFMSAVSHTAGPVAPALPRSRAIPPQNCGQPRAPAADVSAWTCPVNLDDRSRPCETVTQVLVSRAAPRVATGAHARSDENAVPRAAARTAPGA